jgi:hypothetical protein
MLGSRQQSRKAIYFGCRQPSPSPFPWYVLPRNASFTWQLIKTVMKLYFLGCLSNFQENTTFLGGQISTTKESPSCQGKSNCVQGIIMLGWK